MYLAGVQQLIGVHCIRENFNNFTSFSHFKRTKKPKNKLSSVPSESVATVSLSHVVGQQDYIALFCVSGSH